jgi:stage III sporulation protein AH
MNKKQAVIIVTLLVLIVCAGVLAAKVNSPLYVSDSDFGDSSSNATIDNSTNSINSTGNTVTNNTTSNSSATNNTASNSAKASNTSIKSNYFSDSKLTRDKADAKTLETLKAMIDDKNTSAQDRETATQQSIAITTDSTNDTTVESMLKGKGYKDALCTITNDRVTVVVKCDSDKLSDKQLREIKDVVLSVTKLRNIEIQAPVH